MTWRANLGAADHEEEDDNAELMQRTGKRKKRVARARSQKAGVHSVLLLDNTSASHHSAQSKR